MALKENLILYLPLDESPNSSKAYDYSSLRNDGEVEGALFKEGKVGNCAYFDGKSKISIARQIVNFGGDFTISALVKGESGEGNSPTRRFLWFIILPGVDNFLEKKLSASPSEWYHLAIVKIGNFIRYYINGSLFDTDNLQGRAIKGIHLEQDYYGSDLGKGSVDELQFFNKALNADELRVLFDNVSQLNYYLDGINFKENGIRVEGSEGLIDGLKMKAPFSANWLDENGEVVDLSDPRYESREITLNCWIKAGGYMDFTSKITKLLTGLRQRGRHRLTVDINPTKPLVYEVYLPDGVPVKKTWNPNKMVGRFSLRMREPEPVKRVLKHIVTSEATREISVSFKSDRYYNIYWGDGEADFDIGGDAVKGVTIKHNYAGNGDFFPIITGVIQEIKDFNSNAIVVWNEL